MARGADTAGAALIMAARGVGIGAVIAAPVLVVGGLLAVVLLIFGPSTQANACGPSFPLAGSCSRSRSPALQLNISGWARRLHHVSSRKPSAQSGRRAAWAISRSRDFFFARTPGRGW